MVLLLLLCESIELQFIIEKQMLWTITYFTTMRNATFNHKNANIMITKNVNKLVV